MQALAKTVWSRYGIRKVQSTFWNAHATIKLTKNNLEAQWNISERRIIDLESYSIILCTSCTWHERPRHTTNICRKKSYSIRSISISCTLRENVEFKHY